MKRVKNNQKGITLIALVITIIVLLILAGVAVSMLSGENGILRQAANAKTETEKKSTEEQVKLAAMDALMRGKDLTKIEDKEHLEDALSSQGLTIPEDKVTGDATKGYIVEVGGKTYNVLSNGEVKEDKSGIWVAEGNGIYTNEKQKITITRGDYISNYGINYGKSYGWRVLSVEEENGSTYIRLISSENPLSYYHPLVSGNDDTVSIANLTTGFFTTPINTTEQVNYNFTSCRFKSANGNAITNIGDLQILFKNDSNTAKGANGVPKVQSLTRADIEEVFADDTNGNQYNMETYFNGLLTSDSSYWYAGGNGMGDLSLVRNLGDGSTEWYDGFSSLEESGVRVVVDLKSNVILSPDGAKGGSSVWKITN